MEEFETSLKDLIENSPEKEKLLKSLKREIEKRVQVIIYFWYSLPQRFWGIERIYEMSSGQFFLKGSVREKWKGV